MRCRYAALLVWRHSQVGLLAAVAQLMSGEQITGVIALVAVSTCKWLLKIVNESITAFLIITSVKLEQRIVNLTRFKIPTES